MKILYLRDRSKKIINCLECPLVRENKNTVDYVPVYTCGLNRYNVLGREYRMRDIDDMYAECELPEGGLSA